MNTKTQQKTNQLKNLINIENDEIEKMNEEQNIFENFLMEINQNIIIPFYKLNFIKNQAKNIIGNSYNQTFIEVDCVNFENYLEEMNNGTAKLICEYTIDENTIPLSENFILESVIIKIGYLWSDKYRKKIADFSKTEINEVTSDIFGDMVKIRNCIIHNQGYINKKWFKKLYFFDFKFWKLNSVVKINYKIFKEIITNIIDEIYKLSSNYNTIINQKPVIESPNNLKTIY